MSDFALSREDDGIFCLIIWLVCDIVEGCYLELCLGFERSVFLFVRSEEMFWVSRMDLASDCFWGQWSDGRIEDLAILV